MKAIDFEKSALEHGLAIGSKKDFFWVESLDDRIWCLLLSKSAIDFADSLNLEKEAVEGGAFMFMICAACAPADSAAVILLPIVGIELLAAVAPLEVPAPPCW